MSSPVQSKMYETQAETANFNTHFTKQDDGPGAWDKMVAVISERIERYKAASKDLGKFERIQDKPVINGQATSSTPLKLAVKRINDYGSLLGG